MSLTRGARLGAYEVVGLFGVGGMGEVTGKIGVREQVSQPLATTA